MHQIKNANSSFAIIQSKHVSIVIFVRKNILYKVGIINNNKTSVAWKEANPKYDQSLKSRTKCITVTTDIRIITF